MREIVVDTETTGLDAQQGHRIVEIGCVELRHSVPTGEEFHRYLNPERDIPDSAREIHGIDDDFVKDKPRFVDIADELLAFFADAPLVIHNAPFDLGFLNAELERCAKPLIANRVCDTLVLAQERYRAERVSLDALCRRYGIDLSVREKHGALTDARLLARVYLGLCGGRQRDIGLDTGFDEDKPQERAEEEMLEAHDMQAHGEAARVVTKERPRLRVLLPSEEEKAAHRALLARIGKNRS